MASAICKMYFLDRSHQPTQSSISLSAPKACGTPADCGHGHRTHTLRLFIELKSSVEQCTLIAPSASLMPLGLTLPGRRSRPNAWLRGLNRGITYRRTKGELGLLQSDSANPILSRFRHLHRRHRTQHMRE